MGGHIGVLLHQYLLQNGLHPLLVQLRHQAVEDVGQQHPHTRQQPRPGHGAGILRRKPLQGPVPGDADGVHRVPQGPVQIKQQSVKHALTSGFVSQK